LNGHWSIKHPFSLEKFSLEKWKEVKKEVKKLIIKAAFDLKSNSSVANMPECGGDGGDQSQTCLFNSMFVLSVHSDEN
jgi:hypothetical protein